MNEQELEMLRLNARLVALESVVGMVLSAATPTAESRDSVVEALDRLPETLTNAKSAQTSTEYSNLLSSELHTAAESLASFLKERLSQ